jgi:D-inositol-3-phosphate glycosyltransferase
MRRVAIISYHTSPLAPLGGRETGGMNVYVRHLSRELGQRGFLVDVFTRRQEASSPEVAPVGENVRLVRLDAGPARPLEKRRLHKYLCEFEENLVGFASGRGEQGLAYDLLHSHYWLSGWVGLRLKERWGVPHVTMFHTLGEVKNRARLTEHEAPLRIQVERRLAQEADRIVCASQHEKHLLTGLYGADPDRVAVVPCGVDLDLFRPQDKEAARRALGCSDERIILFVGRIEPLKGIDILINAAAQLAEESDFHVLIVGGDRRSQRQVSHLQGLASDLGIGERVCFLGAVDHEKLPLYYNAADVCVVPSYYESFGLVALEAMACGTPVVASRVGGLTGTVRDGETGYLISWRCPEPFAERLELLLDNETLRRRFGEAAREVGERYRWVNVAEAVVGLYEELLELSVGGGLQTPANPRSLEPMKA